MNHKSRRDPLRDAHFERAFSDVPFEFDAAIHESSMKIMQEARLRRRRRMQFIAAAASLVLCAGGALLLMPKDAPVQPAEPVILSSPAAPETSAEPVVPDDHTAIPEPTEVVPASQTTSEYAATAALQLRYAGEEDPCYHKDALCSARIGELEATPMQEIFDRGLEPCKTCCGE